MSDDLKLPHGVDKLLRQLSTGGGDSDVDEVLRGLCTQGLDGTAIQQCYARIQRLTSARDQDREAWGLIWNIEWDLREALRATVSQNRQWWLLRIATLIYELAGRLCYLDMKGVLGPAPQAQPTPGPAGGSEPADFVFRPDGDGWWIKGFGQEGHFQDMLGFQYIYKLLASPGGVPMVELVAGGQATAEPLGGDEVLDQEARDDYRRRLTEIEEELDQARRNNDLASLEGLEREKQAILDELAAAVGRGGWGRKLGDELDKLRSRIAHALERAYQALDKGGLSKVANHFRQGIGARGNTYIYQATERPTWSLCVTK